MKRDKSIEKSYRREINLRTKVVKDKTKYSRKSKHKKSRDYDRTIMHDGSAVITLCAA
jgi:hypothetical protein